MRATTTSLNGRAFFASVSIEALPDFQSLEVGVGHKPHSVSSVRGADGGSWNTVPDRIVPDLGKGPENGSHSETKQAWDVLHDDETGSCLANNAPVFAPQTRSRTFEASPLSSEGNVLAREPAADDIDGNSIGSKSCCGELADVVIARDLWPVLCQDAATEWVYLAERYSLEAAGALKAEAEAADPAEQVEYPQPTVRRVAIG